jgi:hypothetical protein
MSCSEVVIRGEEPRDAAAVRALHQQFGFSTQNAKGFHSPYAGPYLMVLLLLPGGLPATTASIEYAPAFAAFA